MTTTRISIYHGISYRPETWDEDSPLVEAMVFSLADDLDAETDAYRLAYTYEADLEAPFDSLDRIYHDNQALTQTSINVVNQSRSLSVGDVIVLTFDGRTYAKRVEAFGFGSVDFGTVLGKLVK